MGWATWFLDVTRVIKAYEALKPEYFKIYRTGYSYGPIQNRISISTSQMVNQAITAGSKSTRFDPHSAVNSVSNIYTLLVVIYSGTGLVLGGFNVIIHMGILVPYTNLSSIYSWALGSIPGGIPFALLLYFWIMGKDTEFVQEANSRLKVEPGIIRAAEREPAQVFAYQVWNTSLSRGSKIPVMSLLVIVRAIRETWYLGMMRMIRDNFDLIYSSESKIDLLKGLYIELR